ncbi:nucleoside deaminase [Nocardia sp. NPDC060256]|uniref:nucleoside deaminase n=1 Tax=unclassified Nocardia TaxID=2637762 RepID=UPI003651B739
MCESADLMALELPWQLSLEEGWAAFCAGNSPVGAAVTDSDGAVIALGRSRFHDQAGPVGQLAGTALAHAEVNALAQIAPGDQRDSTLWSSLQPCPLCAAAAMTARCGEVRFLAADPMWAGAERLPELSAAVSLRWPRFDGPQPGWPACWQTALSVAFQTARGRGASDAVTAREQMAPRAARLGRALGDDADRLAYLVKLTLPAAIGELLGTSHLD